jgi:hypothetical protein
MNCTKTCPKHLAPAAAIYKLKGMRDDRDLRGSTLDGPVDHLRSDSVKYVKNNEAMMFDAMEQLVRRHAPEQVKALEELKSVGAERVRDIERGWGMQDIDVAEKFTKRLLDKLGMKLPKL